MSKPLDEMISEHIAPVMKQARFRKFGRQFRTESPLADAAFVNFRGSPIHPTSTRFMIELGVVTRPGVD